MASVNKLDLASAKALSGSGTTNENAKASELGQTRLVGWLNVTAIGGTSPSLTVTIQHSADNSNFVTLQAFTAKTATGVEAIQISANCLPYVRASAALSGTTPTATYTCYLWFDRDK